MSSGYLSRAQMRMLELALTGLQRDALSRMECSQICETHIDVGKKYVRIIFVEKQLTKAMEDTMTYWGFKKEDMTTKKGQITFQKKVK